MENDGNDNRIESKIRKGWESDDDNDDESDSLSQSFAEDYGSPRRKERDSMLTKRQEELAARRRALEVAKRRNYERSLNVEMMRAGLMPVPSADKSEEEFSRCGMTRRKWILWSVVFVILTGGLVAYFAAPRSESIPMPPTPAPTFGPLGLRTKSPTTPKPTTDQPTRSPTWRPTMAPTPRPTTAPPTGTPSIHPTRTPTIHPSKAPTHSPTITPPTGTPSIHPTRTPTIHPSKAPTRYPSMMPSEGPSTSSNPTGRMDGYYTPFDRPIRIACVGDSLTRGVSNLWGTGGVDYPKQLQALLGDMFTHRNLGINSVTALRGMSTSYTERWGFTASLEYQPDIYLLMLGTNDSKYWETHSQSYRTDMEWILKTVKIETGARIIVGIPPWVNTQETEYGQIRNGILVNFIQPALRQLAISENVELVDMYKVTVNVPDALTNDGIHLNEKGYRILAEAWKSTIQCNQNGVCEVGETCSTCPGDCYRNCS